MATERKKLGELPVGSKVAVRIDGVYIIYTVTDYMTEFGPLLCSLSGETRCEPEVNEVIRSDGQKGWSLR